MRRVRYSKFTDDDLGLSAEDLMRALGDFFLDSGFQDWWNPNPNAKQTWEGLKNAILQAMLDGSMFDDQDRANEIREKLEKMDPEELEKLLGKLAQKLVDEGYVQAPQGGGQGEGQMDMEVQTTDKSVDFLGFKTLKDLLGSLGRSSFGAHDTRDLSTGIEASGSTKPYEFGDTMNLDITETLSHALKRQGLTGSLELEYSDLQMILAQRILNQEKKDMKQIIMITDGKPSALTLDDGRVYKNAFGLDPLVISRTMEEVSRCKRQGILINTFMLATDPALVNFVRQVTQLCKGKAYFTTPMTLGEYLLMDYMNRKTRTVH